VEIEAYPAALGGKGGRTPGCERRHRCPEEDGLSCSSDMEGIMRKIVLLIAATALFLCSVEVWAGGSRTDTTDNAAVFVISNAL
jgi:hypothetical protein